MDDSLLTLALLAIRMASGKATAKDEPLKSLKKGLDRALAAGLAVEAEKTIQVLSKTGKASNKKVKVVELGPEGEAHLKRVAGPEGLAVAAQARLSGLMDGLQTDRETLKREILATVQGRKAKDPAKEIADLSKKIAEVADRLGRLEKAVGGETPESSVERIDQAFAKLAEEIQSRIADTTRSPSERTADSRTSPESGQTGLREMILEGYAHLCLFLEHESGLVPLPRLYHKVRENLPSVTLDAFHRELEAMWDDKVVQLKILNEVREAAEPDKAIRRGDTLYYFVYRPGSP